MSSSDLPIGFFDSGVGGLTVMREVADLLPNENLLYLGDTARLPYGNKSPEAILRFSLDNASFLLEQKIKLLIVSCHTACSHAIEVLQNTLPVPVLGVTLPGYQSLIEATKLNSVAILGTASTISSGVFQSLLPPHIQVKGVPCPLFVPLVEEGLQDHPAADLIAEHYLGGLTEIDAVLLACTHYPLLKRAIQKALGPNVKLIEPARACALETKALLTRKNLLNRSANPPLYRFFASDDPDKFQKLAKLFVSYPISSVSLRRFN